VIRRAGATLASAPWRRAPFLLLRRPSVLISAAGACLVLAASMSAMPLFLSSAGTSAPGETGGVQGRRGSPAS
jgi:hypothetical protein